MPGLVLDRGLDQTLGVEILELDGDRARGRVPVTDRVKQPYGLVHGGLYATLAETLASAATAAAVAEEGMIAMGTSNNTTFLRSVTGGTVHGEGRCRHSGRTTWVWDVEMSDDAGRPCALSRVTLAVREPR